MSKYITFDVADLFSKWGFEDGDILEDIIYDLEGEYPACNFEEHQILDTLIRRFVIPKITNEIKYVYMDTHHNPCRVSSIDGVYADYYDLDWYEKSNIKLNIEQVEIPIQKIKEIAVREVLKR